MPKSKPIPRTESGLVSGRRIPLGDPRFFNAGNDHNPVVGEQCQGCRGTGIFLEHSGLVCPDCSGIGAIDSPVHFFTNNNPPAKAKARADGWITCPGCKVNFSLVLGYWTGWRHGCGQRIVVLPPETSGFLTGTLQKLRWSYTRQKRHFLALLKERGYSLGHLWGGAVVCLLLIYVIWYTSLIGAFSEFGESDVLRWYTERRNGLHATSLVFLTVGYVSAVGTSWLLTCFAFKHAYGSKLSIDGDGLYGCVSWLLALIYVGVPPLLTTHFVFPLVALRGVSTSPVPQPWLEFTGHVMSNVWIFVGWTATILGLAASVITIYERLLKRPEVNHGVDHLK